MSFCYQAIKLLISVAHTLTVTAHETCHEISSPPFCFVRVFCLGLLFRILYLVGSRIPFCAQN